MFSIIDTVDANLLIIKGILPNRRRSVKRSDWAGIIGCSTYCRNLVSKVEWLKQILRQDNVGIVSFNGKRGETMRSASGSRYRVLSEQQLEERPILISPDIDDQIRARFNIVAPRRTAE